MWLGNGRSLFVSLPFKFKQASKQQQTHREKYVLKSDAKAWYMTVSWKDRKGVDLSRLSHCYPELLFPTLQFTLQVFLSSSCFFFFFKANIIEQYCNVKFTDLQYNSVHFIWLKGTTIINQVQNILSLPWILLCPFTVSLCSQPHTVVNLLPVSVNLPFLGISHMWNHRWNVVSWIWISSLE